MRKISLLIILMLQMITLRINAQDGKKFIYGEKNINYWYHWNPDGLLDNTQAENGWSAFEICATAPREGFTMKGERWDSRISQSLVVNRVAIEGKSKYYFAPKGNIRITAQDGTTYTITPEGDSNRNAYNKLITQSGEQFTWSEATLEETLKSNAIVYGGENAGVFNNDILYAYANGKYTPIVRLTQEQDFSDSRSWGEAGNLELIKYLPIGSTDYDFQAGSATENTVLYDVLNAIGFPNLSADGNDYSQCDFDYSHKNMNRQLHAWIGYVKDDGNNVAQYVEQGKFDDDNKATFLVSWRRPLNAYAKEPASITGDEAEIYIIDYLRLYDWRGDKPNYGYMYDNYYWFWGYYNVKEIDVDLRPENVLTNMWQQQADRWVPLSTVSTTVKLGTLGGSASLGEYPFDLSRINNYLNAASEGAYEHYMGINPVANDQKARFGGISYKNLADGGSRDFTIQVPITVKYEWGSISTMMKIVFGKGAYTEDATVTFTTSRGLTYEADTKTQEAKLIAVSTELTGEVRVPETVKNDGKWYNVTKIGSKAFEGCTQVETVELPKTISDFEAGALSGCKSLKTINVIAGGTALHSNDGVLYSADDNILMAYPAAHGAKFEIPASVKTILDGAFAYGQLYTLTVNANDPNAIAVGNAFEGFDFENCELCVPYGTAAAYRNHAVWGKFKNIAGEQKVTVGNATYSIGEDGSVKITGVDPSEAKGDYKIPEYIEVDGKRYPVTEIAPGAFENCTEMTSVTIPKCVNKIGTSAFKGCRNLEELFNESPVPVDLAKLSVRTRSGAIITQFEGINFDTCILYVPVGSKEAYENAAGWNQFKHIVELASLGINGVTKDTETDVYFNIHGQRVNKPTSGLYIKNGKKVIVN